VGIPAGCSSPTKNWPRAAPLALSSALRRWRVADSQLGTEGRERGRGRRGRGNRWFGPARPVYAASFRGDGGLGHSRPKSVCVFLKKKKWSNLS
jgi:hypothetical protein